MSFVQDQVRRIDAQLDRLQLASLSTAETQPSNRAVALQTAIRGLSPGRSLLKPVQIQGLLGPLSGRAEVSVEERDQYETELEWLLVSKATTQVYGHVLNTILDEAVALSEDLWYWDEVLSSGTWTALYSVQISPLRLWGFGSVVWGDVRARGGEMLDVRGLGTDTLGKRWREFYGLVRQVVRERSRVGERLLSPVTRIRAEIRGKQSELKKVRIRNANALGVLLGEGLANESVHGDGLATPSAQDYQQKWKASVARNVALMETVLAKINDLETPVDKFDTVIGELTSEDPLFAVESHDLAAPPQAVAERLSRVLTLGLAQYGDSTKALVQEHGKPSKVVRYWLPVTLGVLSSSTILRILVNRQAEVFQWIEDLGATVVDFWQNWVVEPTRNLIATIRHDEGSEISIMSKRSLEGDRASLERMVVDFAIDNQSTSKLSDSDISDLRAKVREGDLTPVLKAYEKDLTSPLYGAVRGNLIRALLIQVQKTKVDVEIAMGGIDSLLKSQELLIGFISLTPGLLLTYALTHYIRNSVLAKRGDKTHRKQGKMLRQLRNIDRILARSSPTEYGELLYKDQGLLICEVHVLRQAARVAMPGEVFREFGEEAEELCDVRVGVGRQRGVVERIRWAYGRWLS